MRKDSRCKRRIRARIEDSLSESQSAAEQRGGALCKQQEKYRHCAMSKFEKGKSGNPRGRPPGSANKVPAILKEAIIRAAELAGGEEGLTGYLQTQANANPSAFLGLLGKVLPLQMAGDRENPLQHVHVLEVKRIIVRQ